MIVKTAHTKGRPTQRAPDLGYAPRVLGVFLALGFFRFEGESTLPPQAGNASRWAFHFPEVKDAVQFQIKRQKVA